MSENCQHPGPGACRVPPAPPGQQATPATAQARPESSKNATRLRAGPHPAAHRQPARYASSACAVAVLVDNVPRAGANGKVSPRPLSARGTDPRRALVKQAVGFNAERGDTVSVMNAPFVRHHAGRRAGLVGTFAMGARCRPHAARRGGGTGVVVRRTRRCARSPARTGRTTCNWSRTPRTRAAGG